MVVGNAAMESTQSKSLVAPDNTKSAESSPKSKKLTRNQKKVKGYRVAESCYCITY